MTNVNNTPLSRRGVPLAKNSEYLTSFLPHRNPIIADAVFAILRRLFFCKTELQRATTHAAVGKNRSNTGFRDEVEASPHVITFS